MLRLFKLECKKTLIKQKGIWIILIFILLKLLFLSAESNHINTFIEKNKAEYQQYAAIYSGKLTPQKTAEIKKGYTAINNAEALKESVYSKYDNGELSEAEFEFQIETIFDDTSKKQMFNVIYNQYLYIEEAPEQRYFLYDNGWNALLSTERFDITLILLLFIIVTPIFCSEYEAGMESILLSSKSGRGRLSSTKLLLGSLSAILLSGAWSILEFVFFDVKYGLSNGSFPLESLEYFSGSLANVSLIGAFLSIAAYRIIGYLMASIMIMLISTITKRIVFTLFWCSSLVIVPYFMPMISSAKYRLPLPTGFMLAQGFLRPNEFVEKNGEQVLSFEAITKPEVMLLLAVMFAIMSIGIWATTKFFINAGIRKFKFHKVTAVISFLMILPCIMTGCNAPEVMNYNLNLISGFTANQDFLFYHKNEIIMRDKKTGQEENVLRDVFSENENTVSSIYVYKNMLYYYLSSPSKLEIVEVNLNTHSERVIFELDGQLRSAFFGNKYNSQDIHMQMAALQGGKLFLNEKYIFIFTADGLYRIDRLTKAQEKIAEDSYNDIAFDGSVIYYTSNKHQLVKLDGNTLEKQIIKGVRTDKIYLYDGYIYYSNMKDGHNVYKINLDNFVSEMLLEGDPYSFATDGDYLYYINSEDNNYLYRMDLSNSKTELCIKLNCWNIEMADLSDQLSLYVKNEDGEYASVLLDKNTVI